MSAFALSLVALSLLVSLQFPVLAVSQRSAPSRTSPSHGRVKASGLGVFSDAACSSKVSFVDWGVVDSGSWVNRTMYVRNQGNVAVVVTLRVLNWSPSVALSHFSLS